MTIQSSAAYVGAMSEQTGIRLTRFEAARSYLSWRVRLREPANGCVVVFSRVGGGYVGFVVGHADNGDLMVPGGNQPDAVNIRAFSRTCVTGYRWPVNEPPDSRPLPTSSRNQKCRSLAMSKNDGQRTLPTEACSPYGRIRLVHGRVWRTGRVRVGEGITRLFHDRRGFNYTYNLVVDINSKKKNKSSFG